MGAARADVGAIGDEGDLGVERGPTECELTTPDELEDDMSSVSHTTSATGQPVYWKSKLLQTQSFREHADLVRNVSKEAVGDSCPFCSSTLANTSARNRHFREHCTVLKANKNRFKKPQKGDTSSSTSGSIILKRRSKQAQPSIIVQSSRVEEPQTQVETAIPSGNQIVQSSRDEAPQTQVETAIPSGNQIVQSSRDEAPQTQVEKSLPSCSQQVHSSEDVAPPIQVQKAVPKDKQIEPALTSRDLIISRIKDEIIALEEHQKESLDYIDIPRFSAIYFLEDHNTDEMVGYQAFAGPLRQLLDNYFRDLYQDPLHTEFDTRNRNVCFEKEEFRNLFLDAYALREAEKAREKKKKGQVTTSSGLPSYKRPTSDVELESDFRKYLTNDTGKTMDPLSPTTVAEYVRRIFSETAYNSLISFLRRLPIYGPDFEICQLMFRANNVNNRLVPTVLAQGVMPGQATNLTIHSSSAAASALLKLLRYFKVCASNEEETTDSSGVQFFLLRSQYEHSLKELIDLVQPNIKKTSKDSAKAAEKRKNDIRKRDPELAKLKPGAVKKYFASEHMVMMLKKIETMAKMCNKDPDFRPNPAEFKENTRWLMLMITFLNGARTQSCPLMTEEDLGKSRRATIKQLEEVNE
jgi:hypothetical protein